MNILQSTIISNLLGFLSLLVGIASAIITIKTMKSAKRIEENIKTEKVYALNKQRFEKNKDEYIKKLNRKRMAVSKNSTLSYSLCNDVLSIINDLKGYPDIIIEEDMGNIEQQRGKLQQLSCYLQEENSNNIKLQEFDEIVSAIINILSKGDYEL